MSLEGFPIDSSLNVKLTHDGVTIPISLKLPSYMGGVSGQATLIADNATGLHVSSLHIGVADLNLGALEIKDLAVDYTAQGTVWKGAATIEIPGGSGYFEISAQVEFDHDDLTMGSFQVGVPFPGVPIFSDVYLNGFGGGFDLHPPRKRFFGSIDIGAIPLDPPNYTVNVTGAISLTFIETVRSWSKSTAAAGSTVHAGHREADLPDQRLLRGRRQAELQPRAGRRRGRRRRVRRPGQSAVLGVGEPVRRHRRLRRLGRRGRVLDRHRCLRGGVEGTPRRLRLHMGRRV